MNEEREEALRKQAKAFVDWWHNAQLYFTVSFDEQRAAERGTTPAALLDRVDEYASARGMTRTAPNRWDAPRDNEQKKLSAYNRTLMCLSMREWFMSTVSAWTTYDNETPEGDDHLAICRAYPLKMV